MVKLNCKVGQNLIVFCPHRDMAGWLVCCSLDVIEMFQKLQYGMWHWGTGQEHRGRGEHSAICLSETMRMTSVNSINTMTSIPLKRTYLPTTSPLPLHTHTLPLWACGREVNWQHLLSRRQCTIPNPPHPLGHLETPVWLWAPKVMRGVWSRE